MAQTVSVIVSAEDRARLTAIIGDRSRPLKHVQRARIVLHSANRLSGLEKIYSQKGRRPAAFLQSLDPLLVVRRGTLKELDVFGRRLSVMAGAVPVCRRLITAPASARS